MNSSYARAPRARGIRTSVWLILLLGTGLGFLAQAQVPEYTQARYSGAEAGDWGGAQGAVNGPADNSCANMGAVGKVNLTSSFGFTIPGGSTITGVTAFVRGGEQSEQIVGLQLASNATTEPPTTLGTQEDLTIAGVGNGSCSSSELNELGGNLAFWGTNTGTVNPGVVNNNNFGLVFTKKQTSSVKVDSVCLEISYTHGQTADIQQSCSDDPEPPPVEADSGRTTFTVQKTFADGNDEQDVTIHIQCFTGLPLNQSQTVSPDNGGEFEVEFVVESFDQGELDCDIWEEEVPGYSPSYDASSVFADTSEDDDGCHFDNVDTINAGDAEVQNLCEIVNTPDPVTVTINKEWVIEGSGGDSLDPRYKLILHCEDEILGGYESKYSNDWKKKFNGEGTSGETYTATVIPDWEDGTSCWVDEKVYDDSVEVDNGCGDLEVEIGAGDSCTITNTVFYEGIPTLSQYGMAILALLMLGVGLVGFRRFV